MHNFVIESLESVSAASVKKICSVNRHYIRQLLQETESLNN